jgi:hypothetical protein
VYHAALAAAQPAVFRFFARESDSYYTVHGPNAELLATQVC